MSHQNLHGEQAFDLQIVSGLRFGVGTFTAADNYVITKDHPTVLLIGAAGAIDVLLPAATEAIKGLTFFIFNTSASTITVKSSGDAAFTTAITLLTLEGTMVVCTGSATAALGWRGIATATSA
jgi:hypothetical protein